MVSPYLFGWLALAILYVISYAATRSGWPWALARGDGRKLSASLLQLWVFTLVTVFAYASTTAARIIELKPNEPMIPLPEIPVNLLILMGLSVVTVASSKGITVSYLEKGEIPKEDKGNVFENREGATDLTKAQMLIWTILAAVVYIAGFGRFIDAKCYMPADTQNIPTKQTGCPEGFALPDIDGALLVLMGVSQGGYVAGKLVSRTVSTKVEHIIPNKAKAGEDISLYGISFGSSKDGNSVFLESSDSGLKEIPPDNITEWTDDKVRFKLPNELAPEANQPPKKYTVKIRANSQTTVAGELEVSS
jgi:hypothetical protein